MYAHQANELTRESLCTEYSYLFEAIASKASEGLYSLRTEKIDMAFIKQGSLCRLLESMGYQVDVQRDLCGEEDGRATFSRSRFLISWFSISAEGLIT